MEIPIDDAGSPDMDAAIGVGMEHDAHPTLEDQHHHWTSESGDASTMDFGSHPVSVDTEPWSSMGGSDPSRPPEYLDEAVRPTAEDVAAARAVLEAAGQVPHADVAAVSDGPVSEMSTDDLKALDDKMKDTSENAALLSNIASMKHQTNMQIIGNMR